MPIQYIPQKKQFEAIFVSRNDKENAHSLENLGANIISEDTVQILLIKLWERLESHNMKDKFEIIDPPSLLYPQNDNIKSKQAFSLEISYHDIKDIREEPKPKQLNRLRNIISGCSLLFSLTIIGSISFYFLDNKNSINSNRIRDNQLVINSSSPRISKKEKKTRDKKKPSISQPSFNTNEDNQNQILINTLNYSTIAYDNNSTQENNELNNIGSESHDILSKQSKILEENFSDYKLDIPINKSVIVDSFSNADKPELK